MPPRRSLLLLVLLLLAAALTACKNKTPELRAMDQTIPQELLQAQERLPRLTPHVTPVLSPTPEPATPAPVALTPYAPLPEPDTPAPAPAPTATPEPAPSPTPVPVAPLAQSSGQYVVQPGDTLFDIAQHLQIDLRQLAEFNDITDPTSIKAGQTLLLP